MKMNITRVQDRYNSQKVWLIKRYRSGNYYLNQQICGRTFYDGFVRTTAKHLAGIIGGKELKCLRSAAQ